jgi:hemerythrin
MMLFASYAERHNKLIQIKNGSLTIDVFRSTKARELEWVLDRLHDRTNKDTKA